MTTVAIMDTETKDGLRKRLKQARQHAGLTQAELAKRVKLLPGGEDFGQTTYQALEAGRVKTTGYIVHIALACGVDPVWLATGTGDMPFKQQQYAPLPWEKAAQRPLQVAERRVSYSDVAVQLGYLIDVLDAEGIDMDDDQKLDVAKALARLKNRKQPNRAFILQLLGIS